MAVRRRQQRGTLPFLADVAMLILIAVNLALILFEWFYVNTFVQGLLADVAPGFQQFYDANIHAHFFWIDLGFIAIYLIEIFIQWIVAIVRRTYRKWWYYPFVHWYDVLGCIPISTFRFFRVLRVFSLMVKMQKLEIIDLRKSFLYKAFQKYWSIFTEELSDRVVLNILNGVQSEVELGSPVTEEITRRVLEPRREALVEALSRRLQRATQEAYILYRPDVRQYVDQLIADAVKRNQEIGAIRQLPILGKQLSVLLERAISDIVFNVVNDLVEDVASAENKAVVNHVAQIAADTMLASDEERSIDEAVRSAMVDSIEVIKDHVRDKKRRDDQVMEEETRRLLGSVVREVERPDERI